MATSGNVTDPTLELQQNPDSAADQGSPVTDNSQPAAGTPGHNALPAAAPISQEEFDRLKAERDQLFDRLARLQAEFENARKRESRERADFRDFAIGNAVESFLPVLDNFQLALASPGSVEQLRAGLELVVKQMEDVLRSLNVQPVEAAGAKFDPRVHEALESVERADLPDNQVLDEVRRGYRLRERLLRPALVRVVSNPKQKEA
jgi:molecular chaperone GrpE